VGEVGYESGIRIIDTGGLTDAPIARLLHQSRGEYLGWLLWPDPETASEIARLVLARNPEMVVNVLNGPLPTLLASHVQMRGAYKQDIAMMKESNFRSNYEYLCFVPGERQPGGTRFAYNLFIRKGYKPRIVPTIGVDGLARCG
jgi:hypothetical protein